LVGKVKNWFENMKSIERIPESSLESMEASERTFLERFKESILKNALIAATTIAILLATTTAPRLGHTQETAPPEEAAKVERAKEPATEQEKEKIVQEKAFQFIRDKLLKIPRQKENEAQNRLLTERAVRQLVYLFALQMKLGFPEKKEISGHVSPQEIKRALEVIKAALEKFPDWMYGNKDGKVTEEEKKKFEEELKKIPNPAVFGALQKIFEELGIK
jgi:hypothetical protein